MKRLLLNIIISLVVSSAVVFTYDHFFAQKVVVFDIKGYIEQLRDLYLAKKIDDAELKRRIDMIEVMVNNTPKRKVIIMGDVVIGRDRVEKLEIEGGAKK